MEKREAWRDPSGGHTRPARPGRRPVVISTRRVWRPKGEHRPKSACPPPSLLTARPTGRPKSAADVTPRPANNGRKEKDQCDKNPNDGADVEGTALCSVTPEPGKRDEKHAGIRAPGRVTGGVQENESKGLVSFVQGVNDPGSSQCAPECARPRPPRTKDVSDLRDLLDHTRHPPLPDHEEDEALPAMMDLLRSFGYRKSPRSPKSGGFPRPVAKSPPPSPRYTSTPACSSSDDDKPKGIQTNNPWVLTGKVLH